MTIKIYKYMHMSATETCSCKNRLCDYNRFIQRH